MLKANIFSDFQNYVDNLVDTHKVPAISLAVWHDQKLYEAAAGVLNINTGVTATADSIFQIGSITKVMTASILLQLVDEGRVALDTPVKHYLRDFAIADHYATESITVRQLLTHTNGIAGDFFPDDTRETGNHISRFVDRCNQLPIIHPVGEYYSYSNAAFSIAGRLIEVLTGGSWFDAMEERVFKPLGMNHAICRPMDVLRYRAAIGHFPQSNDHSLWQSADNLYPTLGQAPAGTTVAMSAADLITFARAHLTKGIANSGHRWLSDHAVTLMQQPQISLPSTSMVTSAYAGIGWGLNRVNASDQLFFGHLGGTLGQLSILRIVPDQDVCLAVLVNGHKEGVIGDIATPLLNVISNINLAEPELASVALSEKQLRALSGIYQSKGDRYSFNVEEQNLVAVHQDRVINSPPRSLQLSALDDTGFFAYNPEGAIIARLRFLNLDAEGCPDYLFANSRLLKRV